MHTGGKSREAYNFMVCVVQINLVAVPRCCKNFFKRSTCIFIESLLTRYLIILPMVSVLLYPLPPVYIYESVLEMDWMDGHAGLFLSLFLSKRLSFLSFSFSVKELRKEIERARGDFFSAS